MVAAGPPGFTALALINLGAATRDLFPAVDFGPQLQLEPELSARIFLSAGIWFAFLLLGVAGEFVCRRNKTDGQAWILLITVASILVGLRHTPPRSWFGRYTMVRYDRPY